MMDSYFELLKGALTASLYDESAWYRIDESLDKRRFSLRNPMRFIRSRTRPLIVRILKKYGFALVRTNPYSSANREVGRDWPMFGYTMVGHKRLDNIQWCVNEVLKNNVPGDFAEAGVWRGGSSIFMRAILKAHGITDRVVWLADSFEGMPTPKFAGDGDDLSSHDILAVSEEQVRANFARFDLLDDQVRFIKGWFCDSLPKAPIKTLAILRLDGDHYHSTMDALTNLYDKVSPGGFVIIDDYGSWPSCKQAVTDFRKARNISAEIHQIDSDGVYWQCPT